MEDFKKFSLLKEGETKSTDNTLPLSHSDKQGAEPKDDVKKIIDDAKFDSAYWAGRMIDMPDSKMAWDIAQEIATEINEWYSCFNTHKLLVESYKKELEAMQEYREQERQRINDLLEEIDFFLALEEDSAHGDHGRRITELRGKIQEKLKESSKK